MTIKELKQQLGSLHDKMTAMSKKADAENRQMTAEETVTWDRMDADYKALRGDIVRRETIELHAAELEGRVLTPPGEVRPGADPVVLSTEDYEKKSNSAFTNWVRYGDTGLQAEEKQIMAHRRVGVDASTLRASLPPEVWAKLPPQIRAAEGTSTGAPGGGYLIPTGFSGLLEEFLKAYGGMRQVARIFPTPDGRSIPWPTVDDTANVGEIISENSTAHALDVPFAQVTLKAFKYSSKYVDVSVELLQDSFFDIDSLLAELLAVRIGRITNTHFTTGDNSGNNPVGVCTGALTGVVGAIGQTTSVISDNIYDTEHSVDPAYRPGATWMFADSTLKALKKLKDSTGRMLWQPALSGMAVKVPDMIDGYPYQINQDMPAMAAGNTPIAFGDFKKYIIRDCRDITIVRLVELHALLGQVCFLAFSRHDGRILNANAVKLFQNCAS